MPANPIELWPIPVQLVATIAGELARQADVYFTLISMQRARRPRVSDLETSLY